MCLARVCFMMERALAEERGRARRAAGAERAGAERAAERSSRKRCPTRDECVHG